MNTYGIDLSFDSHVHFFGTGALNYNLNLKEGIPQTLPLHQIDQNLIRGFGWENTDQIFLEDLSIFLEKHPNKDFILSHNDGHRVFATSRILDKLSLKGDPVVHNGKILGYILSELDRDLLEKKIPRYNVPQLKQIALLSQKIFLDQNISHVRHMTCNRLHWQALRELEREGLLKIKIDCFFSEFLEQTFEDATSAYINAVKDNKSILLSAQGIKLFLDGTFGSNTADSNCCHSPLTRLSLPELKDRMTWCLEHDADIALHTIGERAVTKSITAFNEAFKISRESKTKLHLEHASMIEKSIFHNITKLPIVFHFQPSHWIEDRKILETDPILLKQVYLYPFEELQRNNIPFFFGSDSPVTMPSHDSILDGLDKISKFKELIENRGI